MKPPPSTSDASPQILDRRTALGFGAGAALSALAFALGGRKTSPPPDISPAQAQANAARAFGHAVADAVEKVLPSVVVVKTSVTQRYLDFWKGREVRRDEPVGQGSGVVIDAENGYIITNGHVLENAQKVSVQLHNGIELPARFIGSNSQTDIAVLQVEPPEGVKLTAVMVANSDRVRVGETCLAIGSPYSLRSTVTQGIISYKGRDAEILPVVDFIQTSAAINPGNSGGPLVDVDGNLIGINTFIQTAGPYSKGNIGIGFAVPSNLALRIAEMITGGRKAELSFIGVVMGSSPRGVVVLDVMPKKPAELAGLKRGDVIVEWNGQHLTNSEDLKLLITLTQPDTKVPIVIVREGKALKAEVKTAKMPAMRPVY